MTRHKGVLLEPKVLPSEYEIMKRAFNKVLEDARLLLNEEEYQDFLDHVEFEIWYRLQPGKY